MPFNLLLLACIAIATVLIFFFFSKKEKRNLAEIESRLFEIDAKLKELGSDTRTGRRRIFPRQPPRSKR